MSTSDKRDEGRQTATEFDEQLQKLVAEAYENEGSLEGAYAATLDEDTDVEVLVTEVER